MSRRGRRRHYDEPDVDGWTRGFEMVLNVPGVPGDSDLEGHQQWIPLLAWSWGCSRADNDAKKPARIVSAIAAKKKAILAAAMQAIKQRNNTRAHSKKGNQADVSGTTTANADHANGIEQQGEKKSEGQPNKSGNGNAAECEDANAAAAAAAAQTAEDTDGDDAVNEREIAEDALADYDSDNDEDNQFDESELKPRGRSKPNMQNLSLTKYVDIASPLLMLKCLSKEPAFDCTLRICKRREVKKPKNDEKEADAKSAATDEKASDKEFSGAGMKAGKRSPTDDMNGATDTETTDAKEEEKKEYESVVVQEFLLQDCYVSSVSTGGSGGEDRLTENITLGFSRMLFTYTDHLGNAPRGARGEIPTKTVYYDSLRHKAMALDQAVALAIDEQRKLAPVSTVLLDYLNLRSKPR